VFSCKQHWEPLVRKGPFFVKFGAKPFVGRKALSWYCIFMLFVSTEHCTEGESSGFVFSFDSKGEVLDPLVRFSIITVFAVSYSRPQPLRTNSMSNAITVNIKGEKAKIKNLASGKISNLFLFLFSD